MRRLGVGLLGLVVAVAAAVMAAAPVDPESPVRDGVAAPSAAPARISERPRNMAAAIALAEEIRP